MRQSNIKTDSRDEMKACPFFLNLTCEAAGTTADELVDLVHTHAVIQTGRGEALVHLRLTQRA